jgi:gluconate kinase
MIVICLNGPINVGKSMIGRVLADRLPDAEFIEGDDHGIPEGVPFAEMIEQATAWLVLQDRGIASWTTRSAPASARCMRKVMPAAASAT